MAMEDGQPGRAERRRADTTPDDHAINSGVTEWYSPAVAKKPSSAITSLPNFNGQREGFLNDAISPDDATVTISLKDVPRHAWKKVRAEIALVLKVAVETDGKASAIQPKLTESYLQKKRERWAAKKARYRQRLRVRAAASPQP
jgi:hypothetical protein